jgi:hypothetical protein
MMLAKPEARTPAVMSTKHVPSARHNKLVYAMFTLNTEA